jgi:branched-chain amino acid transport system substrate-binding protein
VAYKAMWGREPRATAAMPYYGIYVIAEAIKIAGSDDRAAIRDALTKVDMQIPEIGPVKFDDHNQAHPDLFINQWKDGTIIALQRSPSM